MSVVKIITESSRPGKRRRILNGILPYVRSNRCSELLILVPSNRMVEEIREALLQQESVPGFLGLRLMTFLDLARDIFQNGSFPGRIGSTPARQWRLHSILSTLPPLKPFGEIRETRGMLSLTTDFIRTLKEAGIPPEEFEASPPVRDNPHLRALGEIYRKYEKYRTAQGILDREDLLRLAAEGIRKAPSRSFTSLREIIVTGFYDFTPLQAGFLSALSTLSDLKELSIFLDAPLSSPVTVRSLKRLQHFLPGAEIRSSQRKEETPAKALHHLQQCLSTPAVKPEPVPGDESIELLEVPGRYREVEEMARRIRELHKKHGLSFHDMAVVFRNLSDYREKVREIFRSFGIPHQLTSGLPLRNNPLIRTVTALLECPRSGYRRDAVFRLLASSYLRFEPLERSTITPERIDTLAREAMIQGGRDEWKMRLKSRLDLLTTREQYLQESYGTDRDEKGHKERIDRCRSKIKDYRKCMDVLESFFDLFADLPSEATIPEFIEQLEHLRNTFHLKEQIYERDDLDLVHRDQTAFREWQELLEQLSREQMGLQRVSLADFVRLLSLTLAEKNYSPDPPQEDAVLVTDALGIRGLSRPAVLIGGLVEGIFPRNHSPSPLFSESDRQRLNKHFGPNRWIPLRSQQREEEDLFFRFAVGAAEHFLILSRPRTDGEGHPLLPSSYLDILGALFSQRIKVTCRYLNDPLPSEDPLTNEKPLYRPGELLEYTFRALSRPVTEEPDFPSLLKLLLRERWETCRSLCHGLTVQQARKEVNGSYLGHLGPDAARGIRQGEGNYSVTALERYAACPFQYFCERELKLRPVEEVEEEVGALDLGSLYHRILERFFREMEGPVTKSALAAARKRLDRIEKEELARVEKGGIPGHRKIWEIRQTEIRDVLDRFLLDEIEAFESTGEIPSHFEVTFGMKDVSRRDPLSSPDPLILPSESGEIRMEGKIDRIDLKDGEPPHFSILDYKTGGSKPPGPSGIEKGETLQLPVYAAWALGAFADGRELGHASFVLLRKGSRKCLINPAGQGRQEWKEISERYVRNYVEEIRHGRFPPGEKNCPPYCRYGEICRKGEKGRP
ncbi:MAG: hypothetical protein GXP58_03870 [Deltaproteobacteria bacterium]|nr:hypothetical protein [Deltaproteobacteria bacterium]